MSNLKQRAERVLQTILDGDRPYTCGDVTEVITDLLAANEELGGMVAANVEMFNNQAVSQAKLFNERDTALAENTMLKEFVRTERDAIFHAMTRGAHYDIGLAKERMTQALLDTERKPRAEAAQSYNDTLTQVASENIEASQVSQAEIKVLMEGERRQNWLKDGRK